MNEGVESKWFIHLDDGYVIFIGASAIITSGLLLTEILVNCVVHCEACLKLNKAGYTA